MRLEPQSVVEIRQDFESMQMLVPVASDDPKAQYDPSSGFSYHFTSSGRRLFHRPNFTGVPHTRTNAPTHAEPMSSLKYSPMTADSTITHTILTTPSNNAPAPDLSHLVGQFKSGPITVARCESEIARQTNTSASRAHHCHLGL